jgi:hypothetical protein
MLRTDSASALVESGWYFWAGGSTLSTIHGDERE